MRHEEHWIGADRIVVDLETELITAEGRITWDARQLHATGRRMTFNLRTKTGVVEDVTLSAGPWICRGERVEQVEEKTVLVAPGLVTTCDAPRPHYAIRCRRVRIRLERDLVATSVTVLAGTTPVFWLPVLATPLREFRLPFEAQVGRTAALGAYVRTSPALSVHSRAPGQLHLDYFQRTGWGLGATQDLLDEAGKRAARAHGYRIRERVSSTPEAPRERWELFADAGAVPWRDARVSLLVNALSDARFREQYGNARLGLPVAAGERRGHLVLGQETRVASLTLLLQRADTLRLSATWSGGRYARSDERLPEFTASVRPLRLARWLSAAMRTQASRGYVWRNGWYVNAASAAPALEAFGRVPLLGQVAVTPRLTASWRDRGDRVLRIEDGASFEDGNRGGLLAGDLASSARRTLGPGLDLELTHVLAKRFNRIGYDPFGYRGLDVHRTGGALTQRLGRAGHVGVSGGLDLRNRQDPVRRRWDAVTVVAGLAPVPKASLTVEGRYDVWYRTFRSAEGALGLGDAATGPHVRAGPRYTNNRLALPLSIETSQEYRLARFLYGPSFQDGTSESRIFTVDADASARVLPHFKVTVAGQWDVAAGRIHWYTLVVTRELHCWELVATVQRYGAGETRVAVGLGIAAFPAERLPLLGF